MSAHMPSQVSREQAIEAFKPVFDLLGLSAMETREIRWDADAITIVVVPREPDDESEWPAGIPLPGEFADDDARRFAELSYLVTVEVQ